MNNKSEKEEIKGYISFSIDLNKYTDDLYDDMDYEICRKVEPIQISIYYDSSLNKSDEISNQIQAIATDANSEVFEAIKEMRAEAYSYYFEDENIGGEEAIFSADLWFCEKGKEVYSNGTYIRNTGVPPSGLKFPLYEIFEDVNYNDFDIEDAVKHYEQGLESLEKKEFDSAIKLFTKAITLDSKLRKAYAKRGEAKSKLEDYQEAINDFSKAIELDPTYTSVYVQLAVCLNKVEQFEDSKKYFTEAIKLNPNRISTIDSYAETLIGQNKTDEAIEVLNQGILDNPTEPERGMGIYWLHQGKGEIFFDLNNWEEAIESYLKALEYDRNRGYTHYKLGSSYYNNESYNNSYNSFEIAHEKDSDSKDSYSYYLRGECKRMLDENEQALVEYDLSIKRNNEEHTLHCNKSKGFCYLELKDFSNAVDSFNKGLKDKWSYQNLGKAYFGLSNYEAAVVNFNKVIEIDANYKWAYQEKGKSLFSLKKYQEAEDCFSKVIEIDPNYKWAYQWKGHSLFELEKFDEALEAYELISEISDTFIYNRSNHLIIENLALIHHSKRDFDKADEFYKEDKHDSVKKDKLWWHYCKVMSKSKQTGDLFLSPLKIKSTEDITLEGVNDKEILSKIYFSRGSKTQFYFGGENDGKVKLKMMISDLSTSISLNPKNALAYYLRAKHLSGTEWVDYMNLEEDKSLLNNVKSIDDLKQSLELEKNLDAYCLLMKVYSNNSDLKNLDITINEAVIHFGTNKQLFYTIGNIWSENSEKDKSISALKKGIELDESNNEWLYINLGDTYMKFEDAKGAVRAFEQAKKMNSTNELFSWKLSQAYLLDSQVEKAYEEINKAIESYSGDNNYFIQYAKVCAEKYPKIGDLIIDYVNETSQEDFGSGRSDKVKKDIYNFLEKCNPAGFNEVSIFEKWDHFLDGDIKYFLEQGSYSTKYHLSKNSKLKRDQLDKLMLSGSFSVLENTASNILFTTEDITKIINEDDRTYHYSFKLLGILSNPNLSEENLEKLKTNVFTWVRRKAFSLTKDFTGADLNDKYTVIGLIENKNYPEKETEKLKAKLSDLQSKKYTLKANTENVTILETLSSDITDSKDDILEDLINLDAEDDHSFSDYFRDDWYEYGDSEYGIIESSISLSISDEDSEIYFDFQVPEHIPYPRNPAPGSLLLEVESYEAGGWEFSDFELELEFRPEQFEVSTGDYFGQIYAIEYNNEDSFIEDYDQSDGNLTESRGKDTNISFSVMTESGFTELGLEDINEEIREKIETSGKDINEIKRSIFNKYLNVNS